MKVEAWIFVALTIFFAIVTPVYWFMSKDPTGTTALVLSFFLVLMVAAYLGLIARRIDPRPEDKKDGEIAEGAGELGFFPPASYWPLGLAISAGLMGLGLGFWYAWLMAIAAGALFVTIGGLLFEYYVGQNAQQG